MNCKPFTIASFQVSTIVNCYCFQPSLCRTTIALHCWVGPQPPQRHQLCLFKRTIQDSWLARTSSYKYQEQIPVFFYNFQHSDIPTEQQTTSRSRYRTSSSTSRLSLSAGQRHRQSNNIQISLPHTSTTSLTPSALCRRETQTQTPHPDLATADHNHILPSTLCRPEPQP